jgi:pimeloyl-ACP methyl ester carboxylesterase
MFYTTTGNGEPIVLIHGFGEDSTVWQKQANALQKKYRVILPELPGTGRTAPDKAISMSSMADNIAEILLHEKISSAIVIGHSMGGYITLAFAEKYPQLLKAFGLVHSTAFADTEQKITARKKSMEFISQHGSAAFLSSTTPNLFAPFNRTPMAETISQLVTDTSYILPDALLAFLKAMINRKDKTLILRETKLPVLFIVGKEDQAVPFADTMLQVHLPELSYIHILQRSGHMSMLEETEKCTAALQQFVEMIR